MTEKTCKQLTLKGKLLMAKRPVTKLFAVFLKLGEQYKRIRKKPKGEPKTKFYSSKFEKSRELDSLLNKWKIYLYYGDESYVYPEGYPPYE